MGSSATSCTSLPTGLIRAVGITPAHVREAISEDLAQPATSMKELHRDRAKGRSHVVRERRDDLERSCRAWARA
jgi:hypothetical protein